MTDEMPGRRNIAPVHKHRLDLSSHNEPQTNGDAATPQAISTSAPRTGAVATSATQGPRFRAEPGNALTRGSASRVASNGRQSLPDLRSRAEPGNEEMGKAHRAKRAGRSQTGQPVVS